MTREIFVPSREIMVVGELDTTCRDTAQALGEAHQFPIGTKRDIADRVARLGIRVIEAGFPMTPGDAEQVAQVAATVGKTEYTFTPRKIVGDKLVDDPSVTFTPIITGLSPSDKNGVEMTYDAVKDADRPGMHVFFPIEERNMRARFPHMTKQQVLQMGIDSMRYAREIGGPNLELEVTLEVASTAYRQNPAWMEHCARTVLSDDVAKINTLNIPDSIGEADDDDIYQMFADFTSWVIEEGRAHDVTISIHNHGDIGRASSNSVKAIRAIADTAVAMDSVIPRVQVETTQFGGERVENTPHALFALDILSAINKNRFPVPVEYQTDTKLAKPTVEFIMALAGMDVPSKTMVVGNAIIDVHSGIHAGVIIKFGAQAYSAFDFRWFGHDHATRIKPGAYQGTRGRNSLGPVENYESDTIMLEREVAERIEAIAMSVNAVQLENVVVSVNTRAMEEQRSITDTEIEVFVAEQTGEEIVDYYRLDDSDITIGKESASVVIKAGGNSVVPWTSLYSGNARHEEGFGAITTLTKAVNDALGFDGNFDNWEAHSIEKEASAVGKISLTIHRGNNSISAIHESRDVDRSTTLAYISGINLVSRIDARKASAVKS